MLRLQEGQLSLRQAARNLREPPIWCLSSAGPLLRCFFGTYILAQEMPVFDADCPEILIPDNGAATQVLGPEVSGREEGMLQ